MQDETAFASPAERCQGSLQLRKQCRATIAPSWQSRKSRRKFKFTYEFCEELECIQAEDILGKDSRIGGTGF